QIFELPRPTNDHRHAAARHDAAAAGEIVLFDGVFDIAEVHGVAFELGLIEGDGKLLLVTTEIGDFSDAGDAAQPLGDDPVIKRPQLNEVYRTVRDEFVAKNLAICGGIGSQRRRDTL